MKHVTRTGLQKYGTTPLRLVASSGRHCHVYVIPAREYVKVGMAIDPRARWRTLRVGNPLIEEPIYISPKHADGRKLERAAHQALAAYRIPGGEWFKCSRFLAAEVVKQLFEE